MADQTNPFLQFSANFNYDAAQSEVAAEIDERNAKTSYWTFKAPGTYTFRILPPGNEKLMSTGRIGVLVYKHFLEIPEVELRGIFLDGPRMCPDMYKEGPIADALNYAESLGAPTEAVRKMKSRGYAYFNVVKYEGANADDKNLPTLPLHQRVAVLQAPIQVYDFIYRAMRNPRLGAFLDPLKGADIVVNRVGEKLATKYETTISGGPNGYTPITEDPEVARAIMDQCTDLSSVLVISPERMAEARAAAEKIRRWASAFGRPAGGGIVASNNLAASAAAAFGPRRDATRTATPSTTPVQLQPKVGGGPQMGPNGQPVCMGQVEDRNPGAVANGMVDVTKLVNVECVSCPMVTICAYSKAIG